MANSLLDPEYWGDTGNALAGLLSAPKRVSNALLDAYQTLTQPGRFDQVASDYIMNTPQRFRDNVNSAFPDPRLLNPNNQTPEAQGARESAANALLNFAAPIVYHGSPHSFTKFDSSKIGTGEGAQAFGHGLYVADNPAVASEYKANRSYVGRVMSGQPAGEDWGPSWIAKQAVDIHGDNAIPHLQAVLKQNSYSKNPAQAIENQKVSDAISLINGGGVTSSGNLYKVNLDDAAASKMLDWDKPLSQQAPEVQQLINSHIESSNAPSMFPTAQAQVKINKDLAQKATGRELYGLLKDSLLNGKIGIPGIKYLDGASRGAGQGSSNYVVFPGNEGLLQILERNGQPVK